MNIKLKENVIPCLEELLYLYKNVGWSNYTKNPDMLWKAYENSLLVISAWEEDRLIGVIRVVGDGYSIIYIQDIIVLGEYQHRGIGAKLITEVMNKYTHVYQKVLLTENEPRTRVFYEKMGFAESNEYGCISFVKFNI